jgi:hypothetical protein
VHETRHNFELGTLVCAIVLLRATSFICHIPGQARGRRDTRGVDSRSVVTLQANCSIGNTASAEDASSQVSPAMPSISDYLERFYFNQSDKSRFAPQHVYFDFNRLWNSVAVTLQACIRELPGSKSRQGDRFIRRLLMVFRSPSGQMLG